MRAGLSHADLSHANAVARFRCHTALTTVPYNPFHCSVAGPSSLLCHMNATRPSHCGCHMALTMPCSYRPSSDAASDLAAQRHVTANPFVQHMALNMARSGADNPGFMIRAKDGLDGCEYLSEVPLVKRGFDTGTYDSCIRTGGD